MGKFVVFCAGEFDTLLQEPAREDYLLAADGGLNHIQRLGLTPHGILGDFDSLGYVPAHGQVFPVEKDDTDSMLAARQGLAMGYKEVLFYGALDGPRLDHTVANFQTLQFLADRDARGWLIGNRQIVTVIKDGALEFPGEMEGIVSVFCMGADARGVDIEGLHYGLTDGMLTAGFPLGVSNHFIGQPACVRVEKGSLLVIYERKNGILC